MAWTIKFDEFAAKQIKKLDKSIAKKILNYLKTKVMKGDPLALGKPLLGEMDGLWRYRVENYRIICKIQNKELIVLVLRLGHRKNIYEKE